MEVNLEWAEILGRLATLGLIKCLISWLMGLKSIWVGLIILSVEMD